MVAARLLLILWFVAIVSFFAFGCATHVVITQRSSPANQGRELQCEVIGELNTGTDVLCSRAGIIVHRNSATPAIMAAVKAAVSSFMHGGF